MWNRLNEIVLKSLEIIIYWRNCNLLLAYSHGFSFLEFKKLSSPYQTWEFKAFHRIKMSNNSLTQVFSQSFRSSWALFLYYVGRGCLTKENVVSSLMYYSHGTFKWCQALSTRCSSGRYGILTNNDDDAAAAASFLLIHAYPTFYGYFNFKPCRYFYFFFFKWFTLQ